MQTQPYGKHVPTMQGINTQIEINFMKTMEPPLKRRKLSSTYKDSYMDSHHPQQTRRELAYDTFLGQNPMNRQPFLMNSPAVGASAIDTTSPIVHSAGLFSTLPVGTSPHYEHLNAATAAAVAATAAVQHTQISPDRPPGLPYPFRFTTSHEGPMSALSGVPCGGLSYALRLRAPAAMPLLLDPMATRYQHQHPRENSRTPEREKTPKERIRAKPPCVQSSQPKKRSKKDLHSSTSD